VANHTKLAFHIQAVYNVATSSPAFGPVNFRLGSGRTASEGGGGGESKTDSGYWIVAEHPNQKPLHPKRVHGQHSQLGRLCGVHESHGRPDYWSDMLDISLDPSPR
jgi:hypothetical protein